MIYFRADLVNSMKINTGSLIGGVTEVRILGERACGGITGDVVEKDGKIVITFLKYVEKQENGKWVRSDNHSMPFSNKCVWVDGNLVIRDGEDTVVVVHQSLDSIVSKF